MQSSSRSHFGDFLLGSAANKNDMICRLQSNVLLSEHYIIIMLTKRQHRLAIIFTTICNTSHWIRSLSDEGDGLPVDKSILYEF